MRWTTGQGRCPPADACAKGELEILDDQARTNRDAPLRGARVEKKTFDRPRAIVNNTIVMEHIGYGRAPANRLDATFAALADPTRRAILARLAEGEASVVELAAPFDISQPAISRHLKVLEHAGLISRGRDAQRRPRRIEAQPLAEANAWLERYRDLWEANYQRLEELLEELKTEAPAGKRSRKQQKRPKTKGKRP